MAIPLATSSLITAAGMAYNGDMVTVYFRNEMGVLSYTPRPL